MFSTFPSQMSSGTNEFRCLRKRRYLCLVAGDTNKKTMQDFAHFTLILNRNFLPSCPVKTLSLQVYRDVWSTPVTKPYMAHRVQKAVWGMHFCPFEDVLGVGHGDGFTSLLVPGPTRFHMCRSGLSNRPFSLLRSHL